MTTIVYVIHSIVCFALIVIVLLQAGKGADMGAAFGGASRTVFGPRGAAGPLAKITIGAAVIFMLTCLYLTWATRPRVGESRMNRPVSAPTSTPGQATQPGPKGQGSKTVSIPGTPPAGGKPLTIPINPPASSQPPASTPLPPSPLAPPAPAPSRPGGP